MSYAMHKQVHPPTGVDHACAAYFTHPIGDGGPPNLVVTQANHLTVFAIRRKGSPVSNDALGARAVASATGSDHDDTEVSLEVVCEFDLHGTVGSLCALRRRFGAPRNQRDALLIAVRESKLSVVEFDPSTQTLVNSSLHGWETPVGLGGVPSAHRVAPLPPLAVADPEGRCGAVLLRAGGGSRLALLPAVEGEVDEEHGDDLDEEDADDDDALNPGNPNPHKPLRRTQSEIRSRGTAASVKSSYVLDLASELKISGVRDIVFLHGYGEPTVLVLHEKKPTWVGRLALVNDTMLISAITLDLDNKRHTVIWRRDKLPHSCYRLCAMPDPLGGALVLSQNFLMHESQESSRALALNPLAGGETPADEASIRAAKAAADAAAAATTAGNAAAQDPSLANPVSLIASREGTESASGVSVELDAAQCAVVSEKRVLLTTKQGALMLLTLRVEGRKLARSGAMRLRRAGGAVLSSGMCLVTRKLLFLGSRVGDSLLVSMHEKAEEAIQALPSTDADDRYNKGKKRKADSESPAAQKPETEKSDPTGDDELEAMLYGNGDTKAHTAAGVVSVAVGQFLGDGVGSVGQDALRAAARLAGKSEPGYSFTVRDSVLGISPVIDLTVGASVSVAGDTEVRSELVAACGHGKNGALAVLQRGIHPELVTEVEAGTLPGLRGSWTVYSGDDDDASSKKSANKFHSYLVIALSSSTMVLETGSELKEVSDAVDLKTDVTTLCCGNLFAGTGTRIAQVHGKGVCVTNGSTKTQDICLSDLGVTDKTVEIIDARVLRSYVMCRLSDGSLRILKGDSKSLTLLHVDGDNLKNLPRGFDIATAALVDDSTETANHPGLDLRQPGFLNRGCEGTSGSVNSSNESSTHCMLAVARVGGSLELYSLPTCDKVWTADGFSEGVPVLAPVGSQIARENMRARKHADAILEKSAENGSIASTSVDPPEIVELRIDAFARAHERPLLTAIRGDGSVLAYRAFLCPPGVGGVKKENKNPQLRFSRIEIDVEGGDETDFGYQKNARKVLGGTRLTRFENIGDRGGIRGVFVCGNRPLWLVARRSRVLALPMRGESQGNKAVSFSCFHNKNCLDGFILGTKAGGARICQIPSKMHYEAAWPVRKLSLKCTPHHVQYLPDFKLYALSTSTLVKWKEPVVDENDAHFLTLVNTRRAKAMAVGGVEEQFSLRLLNPGSLECAWQHTLDPGEHVQTVRNVQLRNTKTGALQSMLAIGTAWPGGEDTPCRGRCLLFDVAWSMKSRGPASHTANNQPEWQGRLACTRDAKMACTALSGLEGHLIIAIGNKLIVHSWDGEFLQPVAFFDTPLHTVTINVVKNFILIGDLQKGAYFLRWKDTGHEKLIVQLAKDFEHLDVLATEFLVDGSQLSMLAADTTGNAYSFSYDPKSLESWKGQKLLTKASFFVGSPVNRMVRYKLKPPVQPAGAPPLSQAEIKASANRHAVFHGTLDGSLGILVPTDLESFTKLQKLQEYLVNAVPQPCGLNARSFRQPKTFEGRPTRAGAPNLILDGDSLQQFEQMPWRQQAAAAAAAGMRRDEALGHLRQMSERTRFM